MIQRIQTLYILLAGALTGSLFAGPVANFLMKDQSLLELWLTGVRDAAGTSLIEPGRFWPVWILIALVLFLLLWSVFLFRKRNIQMRILVYTAVLLAGLEGLILYYVFLFSGILLAVGRSFTYLLVFPVLAIVLLILAVGRIRKDELLATAYQRLR